MALTDKLTAIANAIRAKTGKSGALSLDQMATEISGITTGIEPTGTKSITSNGTHDVANYANAEVNVPIPSGYIKPSGTKSITTNGTHDVTQYASATVNVPASGITPSGTKEITTNGEHDVTQYAKVNVNVPITAVSHVITVDSDKTNTTLTLVTGDEFAKKHYTHSGFKVFLMALDAVPNTVGAVGIVAQGNVDVSSATGTNTAVYGVRGWHSAAATFAFGATNTAVTTNNSHVSFRFTSTGNVNLYMTSSYKLLAGSYLLVMGCSD